MLEIHLARLAELHDELGVPPVVVRLIGDAMNIHTLEKRMWETLKVLRAQAETLDHVPDGWLLPDDAESLFGMNLRSLMLEWMASRAKTMRFDYVDGRFTPLLDMKALVQLLGKPLWTSASIEARKEGCNYMTMYNRLRLSGCPFQAIKGWRGARIKVFRADAVEWEKAGWAANGHLSNAAQHGRRMRTYAPNRRVCHGFEQVRNMVNELKAEQRRRQRREKMARRRENRKEAMHG